MGMTVPIPDNQDSQSGDIPLFYGPVEEEVDFCESTASFDAGLSPYDTTETSLVGQWSGVHTMHDWDTDGFVTFVISSHEVVSGAIIGSGLDAQGPFSLHGRLDEDGTITFNVEYSSVLERQRLVLFCEGSAGTDEMTGQCQWKQAEVISQLMRNEKTWLVGQKNSGDVFILTKARISATTNLFSRLKPKQTPQHRRTHIHSRSLSINSANSRIPLACTSRPSWGLFVMVLLILAHPKSPIQWLPIPFLVADSPLSDVLSNTGSGQHLERRTDPKHFGSTFAT